MRVQDLQLYLSNFTKGSDAVKNAVIYVEEICRALPNEVIVEGVLVFSVFRPFGELSYGVASSEIAAAFESILKKSLDKI